MSFRRGHNYHEQGATWTDNVDGSGSNVVITGFVNENKRGTYYLTYSYTDSAGNVGSVTRKIIVKKKSANDNGGGDGNGNGLPSLVSIANGTFMDEIADRGAEPTMSPIDNSNVSDTQNPSNNEGGRVLGEETVNNANESAGGFWGSMWMWLIIAFAAALGLFRVIRGRRLV